MLYLLIFIGGVVTGLFIGAAVIAYEAVKGIGRGLGW